MSRRAVYKPRTIKEKPGNTEREDDSRGKADPSVSPLASKRQKEGGHQAQWETVDHNEHQQINYPTAAPTGQGRRDKESQKCRSQCCRLLHR